MDQEEREFEDMRDREWKFRNNMCPECDGFDGDHEEDCEFAAND